MRKLILYTAMSLDGKIAGPDDDVSWLDQIPNPDQSDYGYGEFVKEIDTTLMGGNTYRWIMNQDIPFPYPDTDNFVLTRDAGLPDNEHVSFINDNHVERIKAIKSAEGKDIWLIGGAQANRLCLAAGIIDELRVFVMPVILGEGITLVQPEDQRQSLELADSKTYQSGVVELRYRTRP